MMWDHLVGLAEVSGGERMEGRMVEIGEGVNSEACSGVAYGEQSGMERKLRWSRVTTLSFTLRVRT